MSFQHIKMSLSQQSDDVYCIIINPSHHPSVESHLTTMHLHHNETLFNENIVISLSKYFPKDVLVEPHYHRRGQIIYADSGVMELYINHNYWLIPPLKGIWIPPYCEHQMRAKTNLHLKTLYIDLNKSNFQLPTEILEISISPLLKELLIRASNIPYHYSKNSFEEKLLNFTIDEILNCKNNLPHLPIGKDPRIQSLCKYLIKNPKDKQSLTAWGLNLGASPRTIMRLFQQQTGLSYTLWRENLKVLHAITLLTEGKSVGYIATNLGYASQSSFSVMFKRITGTSPKDYVKKYCSHAFIQP